MPRSRTPPRRRDSSRRRSPSYSSESDTNDRRRSYSRSRTPPRRRSRSPVRSRSPARRRRDSRTTSRSRSPPSRRRQRSSYSRSRSPSPRRQRSRSRSPGADAYDRVHRSISPSPKARRLSKKEIKALKKERLKEKEARKREKEKLKQTETAEEKIQRRLAKKAAKAAIKEKKLEEERKKFAGYTNNDNPFGDTNLDARFVWHKKREQGVKQGLSVEEQERRAKQLRIENQIELEKVKRKREEKERELEALEEEKRLAQQEKEDDLFRDWMAKEEGFHMDQARMRSAIRIKDGRAKPIDILAHYITKANDDTDLNSAINEPYAIFTGLALEDMEDLQADIRVYEEIGDETDGEYWADLYAVCKHELAARHRELVLQKKHDANPAERRAVETGVNASVLRDIQNVFKGKTRAMLVALKEQVRTRLASGDVGDVQYWETMLKEVTAEIARAGLRERHQAVLQRKLDLLRQRTMAAADAGGSADGNGDDTVFDEGDLEDIEEDPAEDTGEGAEAIQYCDEPPIIMPGDADWTLPPKPTHTGKAGDTESDEVLVDPLVDARRLFAMREFIVFGRGTAGRRSKKKSAAAPDLTADERSFVESQAQQKMGQDEEAFNDTEVTVGDPRDYLWRDKYKPRKPRFFNRVHTGFEWNKYNQTHYDSDNPPPKVVQGYKFNIFYPDLIDKRTTPDYTITPIPSEPGFAIIRFIAGAPYEDIAFKIVDKPWEMGHKRGFRCHFSHNILQVWFHFRRERYRR
eukprot:m.681666 g.681666  ORF g.681666 m.681666 type:complete len:749 (-) comp22812_c0_seq8:255-2501(-)